MSKWNITKEEFIEFATKRGISLFFTSAKENTNLERLANFVAVKLFKDKYPAIVKILDEEKEPVIAEPPINIKLNLQ